MINETTFRFSVTKANQSLATRSVVMVVVALLLLSGGETRAAKTARKPAHRPKLAVVLVFDQLRADYLTRWRKLFVAGGLKRVMDEGAGFQNCHYPYSRTTTAAGHASIFTGCSPDTHGIVDNSWYDRALKRRVISIQSPLHRRVPLGRNKSAGSGSPVRMLAPTLADALKDATRGKGLVVSLSFKDRSAILPGGKKPDACYWLDKSTGEFVTSTYYQSDPHPWIRRFNARRPADRWFGRTWNRVRSDIDYKAHSGPDDVAGEWTGYGQGRTFPHPMGKSTAMPGKPYYNALINSPFGNDLMLDLLKEAVIAEKLGADDVPDLLCVSFSSNDVVGHSYGPDSQEVLDMTLRTDLLIREVLLLLDARVGKGRYVLAVTADHGVCPLPEVSRAKGKAKDADRYFITKLRKAAEDYLQQTLGTKKPVLKAVTGLDFYLNQATLRLEGISVKRAESLLAGFLKKQPGLQTAYTRTQLLGRIPPSDKVGRKVQKAFFSARSGDVIIVSKPYSIPGAKGGFGTTHGSPHAYDTHVPLLFFGGGIKPGARTIPITPQAVAAILSAGLHMKPPAKSVAKAPADVFQLRK